MTTYLSTVRLLAFQNARGLSSTITSTARSHGKVVRNVAVPGLRNGMDYVQIGGDNDNGNLVVSKVGMGTMTFGQQNTAAEGVAQLHRAWDEYGVNVLDTAELYPVPPKAETQGATDRTVAQFLQERPRDDVVLATKGM